MSDRIAVMNDGRVEQAGPPQAVYEDPETLFVADFLGVSNLIAADATGQDGDCCNLQVAERVLRARQGAITSRGEVKAMIRPERVGVEPAGARRSESAPRPGRARRLPGQLPRAARPHPRREPDQGGAAERRRAACLRAGSRRDAPLSVGRAPRPRTRPSRQPEPAEPAEEPSRAREPEERGGDTDGN